MLTNSLPIMTLLASDAGPNVELIGIGGTLRALTRSFVGAGATRTVNEHYADRLFLSVKGVVDGDTLTDADSLEADVKRTMIAHARDAVLLIDGSKLERARPERDRSAVGDLDRARHRHQLRAGRDARALGHRRCGSSAPRTAVPAHARRSRDAAAYHDAAHPRRSASPRDRRQTGAAPLRRHPRDIARRAQRRDRIGRGAAAARAPARHSGRTSVW